MALDKNKTGIMAAISAATEGKMPDRAQRSLPRGTIGSVRAGLGGIQDIDCDLILPWGPQDRMELTAVNSEEGEDSIEELAHSIQYSGQQVPVLLRPSPEKDGYFDVIYGRRRILACRKIGQPVKALVRAMDETEALLAKGLENSSRQDLSFYERARFAQEILDQGHARGVAYQALAISKNTLSQLLRVTRLVPDPVGLAIGPAPDSGRPKWMVLADAFEECRVTEHDALSILEALPDEASSDTRLEALCAFVSKRGTPAHRAPTQERAPAPGVTVKSKPTSVTLTVKRAGQTKEFADWFEAQLDQIVEEAFDRFQSEAGEGQGGRMRDPSQR